MIYFILIIYNVFDIFRPVAEKRVVIVIAVAVVVVVSTWEHSQSTIVWLLFPKLQNYLHYDKLYVNSP